MTLHPTDQWIIPAETAKVARAAFPKGNVYMKMRDTLGQLYYDHDFTTLFRADCGKVALSPGQLALITVMQFAEGLTDRQAADQVRARLDWKYALALELTDSGSVSLGIPELMSMAIESLRYALSQKTVKFVPSGSNVLVAKTHLEC